MQFSALYTLNVYLMSEIAKRYLNPYAACGQFCQCTMIKKTWIITETLAYGYSSESAQRELSNEYQHERVRIFFKTRYQNSSFQLI